MGTAWDTELGTLLSDLSAVQGDVLQLLGQKRALLLASDLQGLAEMQPKEELLIARLKACLEQRARLLALAAEEGLPNDSIRSLTGALPRQQSAKLSREVHEASGRSRLLQHQSLTNWVVVQRSLLHLSQILEIIATGGRTQPTYGMGHSAAAGGVLVDQAA